MTDEQRKLIDNWVQFQKGRHRVLSSALVEAMEACLAEVDRLRAANQELRDDAELFESMHEGMKEGVAKRIADLEDEVARLKGDV